MPPRKPWAHVATVASESEPGKRWEIKKRRSDGALGCACPAFRFKHGDKTCKHIRAYLQASPLQATQHMHPGAAAAIIGAAQLEGRTTDTVRIQANGGEFFNVTRAIAFGVLTPD